MNLDNIITLSGVGYGYSLKSAVLDGIHLTIHKGQYIGLLGPSGSGKTTLLKIIIGLIKPWHGSITFAINSSPGSNKITLGYVPQVESVDWNFPVTVREVVAMGIWNQSGVYPWLVKNAKEEVDDVLEGLGIGEYGSRQIRELSGGEQQRVFLARALIRNPDVLVLDEPTSGVDYNTREKILENLNDLNVNGMTIILTTHDLSGIARRLPWVVCINRNIIAEGKPEDTLTEINLLKTYGLADITPTSGK
ncbi:MAG: metal ABC transporter ATP-binding protein [Nitrososphaerota archaeon]